MPRPDGTGPDGTGPDGIRIFLPEEDTLDADDPVEERPDPTTVFEALLRGEYPRSLLVGLSDPDAATIARFGESWPQVDPDVRRAVMLELRDIADDRLDLTFERVYIAAMDDDDPIVRQHAIGGLWEATDSRLADRLMAMLHDDPSEDVRAESARALGHFATAAEFLEIDEEVGDRVREALLSVLETPEVPVQIRARALESAAVFGQEPRVRAAIDAFFDDDDTGYRATAVFAMGRTCSLDYLPTVLNETASDDAEVRFEAARAAGSIGDEDALSTLGELTRDEDWEVRHAAVAAIGEIGGPAASRLLRRLAERADDAIDLDVLENAQIDADLPTDPSMLDDDLAAFLGDDVWSEPEDDENDDLDGDSDDDEDDTR